MSLVNKAHLCYINAKYLEQWIKENNFPKSNVSIQKEIWKKAIDYRVNFFTETELISVDDDIIVLKIPNQAQLLFLAKNYQLEHQSICQKLFKNKKNIILVTDNQSEENEEKIILLKDKESIDKSLAKWISSKNN
ncbi:MAG: hypothetical protein mread185_000553 [Mycoplasmataceae bacterium]|nr:MAG: hypothetical protein mread185_000553 [Mycoplasmataceae bacterium]